MSLRPRCAYEKQSARILGFSIKVCYRLCRDLFLCVYRLFQVFRSRRTPRAPSRLPWSASSEKSGDDLEHLEASQRTPQASQPLSHRDTGRKGRKRGRSLISTVSPAFRIVDVAASVPKKAKKDSRIQNFALKVISLIGNGSVKESFIRGSCGNNPDVSKALRV